MAQGPLPLSSAERQQKSAEWERNVGQTWKVEDRIAGLIATVVYTSDHIDMVRVLPKAGDPPEKMSAAKLGKWRGEQNKEIEKAAYTSLETHADFLKNPTKPANPAFQATVLAGKDPAKLPAYKAEQVVYHTTGKANLGVYDISEIDNDTIAVAIVGGNLYVACNYKIRSMVKNEAGEWGKTYLSFGAISDTAKANVTAMLRQELRDLGSDPGIRKIVYLGPTVQPISHETSAAPHAEMQIFSWFDANHLWPAAPPYFGVSKACCQQCADQLDGKRCAYRDKKAGTVTNWASPDRITCKVYSEEAL